MNGNASSNNSKLPRNTPQWLVVLCCLVGSVIVPLFVAFSPHFSELVKGATEVKKAQAENEKTALGTILDLVNTTTKQVYVLTIALEAEQREKKQLTARVADLEKSDLLRTQSLEECLGQLNLCKGK